MDFSSHVQPGKMKSSLHNRVLWRELGSQHRDSSIRGMYGDKTWVNDLDIVNELAGHSGCVNALSWSKSGKLLASGSDDTHLLIHSYQAESTKPFSLVTSLSTGHRANIFSVKFMPHSNDNTVVSCAGDGEVRVFDIEHTGRPTEPSNASSVAAARQTRGLAFRLATASQGVKYLNDGNTNARVYRSHSDRVKRIVTESSPFIFLTCSEDGEVRQFDARLPSSSYPRPIGGANFRYRGSEHDDSNTPPPLISYKRHHLELNTISCSASQPHYIVLGGAHLHCFLHDRRMTGRDLLEERGSPGLSSDDSSDLAQHLMGEATLCVRRFAPNGKKRMGRRDRGHVTACKISDANPNEMIGSWSSDHIYSFDLVRSADALEQANKQANILAGEKRRTKESRYRKRKRKQENSTPSTEGLLRGDSRARRELQETNPDDVILRVRYENGQSEDIAVEQGVSERMIEQSRESVLNDSQKRSLRIAKSVVKIRKLLFSLDASVREPLDDSDNKFSTHEASFSSAYDIAASLLPEMDEIVRTWKYPVGPNPEEVAFHATLRKHRDSARRFVQACGTLARVLCRNIHSEERDSGESFDGVKFSATSGRIMDHEESFRYTFLKAILLWLEGGPEALLDGFKRKGSVPRRFEGFFPVSPDANTSAIDSEIIPLLTNLSRRAVTSKTSASLPIANVDASRFETDENRYLFPNEIAAVNAFSHAIKIPLQDMPSAIAYRSNSEGVSNTLGSVQAQDRKTAFKYWGFKIGRGLLMNAGDGVNFALVDRAYGGLGVPRQVDDGRSQEDIEGEEDVAIDSPSVATQAEPRSGETSTSRFQANVEDAQNTDVEEEDDEDSDEISDEDTEDEEDVEDEEGPTGQFLFRGPSDRIKLRASLHKDIPVHSHTRSYRGHCNAKTVKDVNFFGLEDEYVVSGCDSGHFFIWDRKTTRLLNILKGDGEVVNVIHGHPYEPMLAVSGIDHTIKIFSPDHKAQRNARLGINVNIGRDETSGSSSLSWSRRRRRSTNAECANLNPPDASDDEELDGDDSNVTLFGAGLASRRSMHRSYEIISQNDIDRASGSNEAFITRDMLAQLVHIVRRRGPDGNGGGDADGEADDEGEGDEGMRIVLDDRCHVQ